MATTATLQLTSDLLSNNVSVSTNTTCMKAGTTADDLDQMDMGYLELASGAQKNLFDADNDLIKNKANKVYVANKHTDETKYIEVYIATYKIGRLYAGDWMIMPWSATAGTKRVFTVTIANTWAAGDTWEFDGITLTAADSTTANIAAQIDALNYPNWTTTHVATESTIIFTERYSSSASYTAVVTGDGTLNTAGDGTAAVSSAAVGAKSEADISIRPSVHTDMTIEHALFNE